MISVTTGMLLPFVMGGVLATPYLPMLYRRATDSFDVALAAYEERFQQGIQPSTPVINLYSHDTQETLLVVMNAGYMVATCCLYLFMRRRDKPFQLRRVLTVYNMVNVLLSTYISAAIIMYKFKGGPNGAFICNKVVPGDPGLTRVFAIYYAQKFFEFCDTYFFILRRSFRQVRRARSQHNYHRHLTNSPPTGHFPAFVPPCLHHGHCGLPHAL